MHLTNYAINKHSPAFVFNRSKDADHVGHKRSFTAVLAEMARKGCDVGLVMQEVKVLVVKTVLAALPKLRANTERMQPGQCFELFGFDILIRKDLKPFLLEVNHTPSFKSDTPLDL
jgi:hypothetical protein